MFAVKGIKTGLGLAALFALLVSGLALVATGGAASASTTPGHTIATAGTLNIGGDTASGGGGPTDFWKVRLNGGNRVSIDIDEAGVVAAVFDFQLYAPGTADATFPKSVSFSGGSTDADGRGSFYLQAPYTGTFVLAVCEGRSPFSCNAVGSEGRDNPMDPYTFTTKHIGGFETTTGLSLSAKSITYGHERGLKFSARVYATYGGTPTGRVTISDGRKTVCTIKLSNARGSCSIAATTTIPVGTYKVTASYSGNRDGSKSSPVTLTVKK